MFPLPLKVLNDLLMLIIWSTLETLWACGSTEESKSQNCHLCKHSEGQISPPVSHVLCDQILKKGNLNAGGPFCCSFYGVLLQQVREKLLCRNFCTQFLVIFYLHMKILPYLFLVWELAAFLFIHSLTHSLIHSFIHSCPCCWQLSPPSLAP